MMPKNFRALLLVLSMAVLGACQSDLTGPDAAQEGYAGSGGQVSPLEASPELTEGYAGSGG